MVNGTIKAKDLPYGYMSLTFGTFGSFGEGTWRLITKACDPTTHPKAVSDCDPCCGPISNFQHC